MNQAQAIEKLRQLINSCENFHIDFLEVLAACGHRISRPNTGAPRPYVFDSDLEFQKIIQSDSMTLLADYLAEPFESIQAAVVQSVAGNTFRAFHLRSLGVEQRPSAVYRQLVTQIFEENFQRFTQLACEEDYDRFILESARRVEQRFDEVAAVAGFMGFGRASKLFNLSCKAMLRYQGVTAEQRQVLARLAHVPWDSFTIQGIRHLNPPFAVPTGQGMGWDVLNDEQNYLRLLQWIRTKCYELGFFPIHYEVVAWDRAHR
jgi:hypothetical protein